MIGTNAKPDVVLCAKLSESVREGDDKEGLLYQSRLHLLALKKWKESFGKSEVAQVVGLELSLDDRHIDRVRLREVKAALDARVQQDAIEISVCFGNAGNISRYLNAVSNGLRYT